MGITGPHFGSHWIIKTTSVHFTTVVRYTTSLFFSVSGPLWLTRLWTTNSHSPVTHPALWVGEWDGDILGCIHVCPEKEVGLEGGGFVIVTGQIPGGKFLACLCGRISNQRPAVAPLLPGPGNPINCVRQRELVSIDPHSAAFWLADKGHSHVETNARAEQPGGGPVLTNLLSSLPGVWSYLASVLIKQETAQEWLWTFGLGNQIHSPLVSPVISFNLSSSTHVQAQGAVINWVKVQYMRPEISCKKRPQHQPNF